MGQLSALDMANVRPDGVKSLRVDILAARELIDIFIWAYPNSTSQPTMKQGSKKVTTSSARRVLHKSRDELILAIRSQLDAGYESLGNFQDLAHSLVAYNESDVIEARSACLSWRSSFLNEMLLHGFLGHLSQPSTGVLYHRKRSDLSPLFWGCKGTPTPSISHTGLANLALMTTSMIKNSLEDLPPVIRLPQVHTPKANHEQFHNYRKLIRSLLAVLQFFPQLLPPQPPDAPTSRITCFKQSSISWMKWASCHIHSLWCHFELTPSSQCKISDPVSVLQKAFKDLGQVNNYVFAWSFYTARGDEEEAEEALQQVTQQWAQVQEWLVQVNMDQVLREMKAAIENEWLV